MTTWRFQFHDRLLFTAKTGSPAVRVKFYTFPNYKQQVIVQNAPHGCKLQSKEPNRFFIFQKKVRSKGILDFSMVVLVTPTPSFISLKTDWGMITDFESTIQSKYLSSVDYWPVQSPLLQDISTNDWFHIEDLAAWTASASRFIVEHIPHRMNQSTRLGVHQALKTGTGDCDEFTDLFVTLARKRGIPARRLTGYHLTDNFPTLHAWAEILTPLHGWVPIDLALNNIGRHSAHYVILKLEEFVSNRPDYQVSTQHPATVHFRWDRRDPIVTPLTL